MPVVPGPSGPGLAAPTGSAAPARSEPGPAAATGRADPPRTATQPPTQPPTRPPAADEEEPSPDVPSPSAFVVGVTGGVACAADGFSYRLAVSVQANRTMSASRLYWHSAQSGTESTALTPLTRASARGGKGLLRHPEIEWWVRGTAPDGTSAESPHRTSANPCP